MRHMILLNDRGDVEITWAEEDDAEMIKIIEEKMRLGVRFFVIAPKLGILNVRKRITDTDQIKDRKVQLGDEALERMFVQGRIEAVRYTDQSEIDTVAIAKTPMEVVQNTTVGIRQFAGG